MYLRTFGNLYWCFHLRKPNIRSSSWFYRALIRKQEHEKQHLIYSQSLEKVVRQPGTKLQENSNFGCYTKILINKAMTSPPGTHHSEKYLSLLLKPSLWAEWKGRRKNEGNHSTFNANIFKENKRNSLWEQSKATIKMKKSLLSNRGTLPQPMSMWWAKQGFMISLQNPSENFSFHTLKSIIKGLAMTGFSAFYKWDKCSWGTENFPCFPQGKLGCWGPQIMNIKESGQALISKSEEWVFTVQKRRGQDGEEHEIWKQIKPCGYRAWIVVWHRVGL